MAKISAVKRLIEVKFDTLDADVLVPVSFAGQEPISGLFSYQLEMLSSKDNIAAKDVVGKAVMISIKREEGAPRYFHGFVNRFRISGRSGDLTQYQAEVVPWLWFLTCSADCRIFPEKKTVVEIIEQVFKDHGFSDFDTSQVKGSHPKLEYCVQYRETAFNFVSRLMEQEGIFYFFQHEEGKHTLVMADNKDAYVECPVNAKSPKSEVTYQSVAGGPTFPDRVSTWEHDYEFRPVRWAQTDYNFKTPANSLLTKTDSTIELPGPQKNQYEMFDYPGEFPDKDVGQEYTDIRMQEDETPHDVASGSSSCKMFSPGHWFKLKHNEMPGEKGEYLITSVQHWANNATEAEGGAGGGGAEYGNTFTCIPKSVLYRPPRITPKPVIQGPHTAVVVSDSDQDIDPDEYGRVKVLFHWVRKDLHKAKQEHHSCWVRVSQNWAGQGWGGMFIPHSGQEVIVEFLEGDPDHPIITGRVYNAKQKVPLDLPANKTKSIIRDHGGNEIVMEGADGKQQIRLFSPTENSLFTIGDGCCHQETEGNHICRTGGNRSDEVAGNEERTVEGSVTKFIVGDELKKTDGSLKWSCGGEVNKLTMGAEVAQNLSAKSTTTVGIQHSSFVGAKMTVDASVASTRTYGFAYEQRAAKKKKINGVDSKIVDARSKTECPIIVYDASTIFTAMGGSSCIDITSGSIDINCGGSSISLAKGGVITIKCSTLKVEAGNSKFSGNVVGQKLYKWG